MPPADGVDVWFADLACPMWQSGARLAVLCDEERARARRFRFAVHRMRFCAARVALRSILSTYVQQEPASLSFRTNGYGKPHLEPGSAGGRVHFNLSHSEHMAMFAVSRERIVGADIERIRMLSDVEGLARRVLAPSEAAAIRTSSEPHLQFFQCWTRKEAVVKACGRGLTVPLKSFEVKENRVSGTWTVVDVPAPADFVCALAVQGEACRVRSGWWEGGPQDRLRNS